MPDPVWQQIPSLVRVLAADGSMVSHQLPEWLLFDQGPAKNVYLHVCLLAAN